MNSSIRSLLPGLLPLSKKMKKELLLIAESGLFDEKWYVERGGAKNNPVLDYYLNGRHRGISCNYLFDEAWYLKTNPDVRVAGIHPLAHYLRFGEQEKENRRPSPFFDPRAYRESLPRGERPENLLRHYLAGGWLKGGKPVRYFEPTYYVRNNPDIGKLGVDPYFHYLFTGYREGRRPSARYTFDSYCARYGLTPQSGISPLAHFLYNHPGQDELLYQSAQTYGSGPWVAPAAHPDSHNDALKKYRVPGAHCEDAAFDLIPDAPRKARVFAFYLPQFHPIPENDEWWGKGFTEWTNSTRGLPRFSGHYQPHLPSALGFYDLRREEVMAEQIALARQAGISGFSFYYYNFNGKRLLERPINTFLARQDWDFEFCLTWANENWTRRWDGLESDILMSQDYLPGHDLDLVEDLARHFADRRYIRILGRPLFILYRPGIIPEAAERIATWRRLLAEIYGEYPLIYMALGFDDHDPYEYGLDGAIEFPPHKLALGLPELTPSLGAYDPAFAGNYFSYDDLIAASVAVDPPEYPLIRTAVPMWDNEARKPGRGMGFVDASPAKYEHWLSVLMDYAQEYPVHKTNPMVFVNAWNEWAEGAHLEPDIYWGHAYLNATKRAVTGYSDPRDMTVVYVGHDAYRHGAQLLSLNIVKTMARSFGIRVEVVLLDGGPLVPDYEAVARTHVAEKTPASFRAIVQDIQRRTGARYAICNTVVTGHCCEELQRQGLRTISLVHELENLIKERGLEGNVKSIAEHADKIVFAAKYVRDSFVKIAGKLEDKEVILPQGAYQEKVDVGAEEVAAFRKEHGIPASAKVVINAAYGDLRKGYDLFLQLAQATTRRHADYHFVWIGDIDAGLAHWVEKDVEILADRFTHIPFTDEYMTGLAAADVFCLTSREDPYPSVVLDALAQGLPVIAFEKAGGFAELLEDSRNGDLVPFGDLDAMRAALLARCEQIDGAREDRRRAAGARFDWSSYVFSLAQLLSPALKRVSVVVPNYNCAPYIEQRLASIFRQRYPIYELIILDDASTDIGVASIREILSDARREARLVVNEKNSGSAFHQWIKGADLARGDYLWIAEADDASNARFLSELMPRVDGRVVLGYADSRQINQEGTLLAEDYQYYYGTVDTRRFHSDFRMAGRDFVGQYLSAKNLILNVSGTVIRREDFCRVAEECREKILGMKVAGDWYFYVKLLARADADVVFVRAPLNTHRRHEGSITSSLGKQRHFDEVVEVQELAAGAVELGEVERKRVDGYREELRGQFGLGGGPEQEKTSIVSEL